MTNQEFVEKLRQESKTIVDCFSELFYKVFNEEAETSEKASDTDEDITEKVKSPMEKYARNRLGAFKWLQLSEDSYVGTVREMTFMLSLSDDNLEYCVRVFYKKLLLTEHKIPGEILDEVMTPDGFEKFCYKLYRECNDDFSYIIANQCDFIYASRYCREHQLRFTKPSWLEKGLYLEWVQDGDTWTLFISASDMCSSPYVIQDDDIFDEDWIILLCPTE